MKNNKLLIGSILFISLIFLIVRYDWIVHYRLYFYGLQFSYEWANEYWFVYGVVIQVLIITFSYFLRNKYFFAITEAFFLSDTHDLVIFFGLFSGWFPTENWWWMKWAWVFGEWYTFDQIILSAIMNVSVVSICIFHWFINHRTEVNE